MPVRTALQTLSRLVTDPLDPDRINDLDTEMVELCLPAIDLLQRYFRAEVHGIDRIPGGPALLVGNHNAGITFMDPFFLGTAWFRRTGGRDPMHYLAHDAMVRIPALGNFLMRGGAIRASHHTADAAFAAGHKVVVFPGGNYEAFRPFRERHKVDFGGRTGFVRLALRNRAPIVPVLHLGGHETFVVLRRGERLAKLLGVKRFLRSDAFPVFLGLPWGIGVGPIFHLPLPAKVLVEVGEPIPLDAYGPEAADDRASLQAIRDMVQDQLQRMMDRRADERRWPILG